MAEFKVGDERKNDAEETMNSYKAAQVVLLTGGMDTRPYHLNWPKSTVVFDISPDNVFKRAAQKLEAPGSVVGWPPIRSFRKNIASGYAPKLLAAQNDPSINNIQYSQAEKSITGLLDGSGEYTLVYEDNEGDIMLVGDVPWQ
ncbi:hypothetical protein AgCh_005107 [Apium graveolens]